ncbi:MAG: amidohydrolase family protein [Thermodesulfobacteriota bacterium]|nr:amidohydrolase family protein [Thermodesulfobacteriota bacterium]
MIIDFHGHFYPRFYLEKLAARPKEPYLRADNNNRKYIYQNNYGFGPIEDSVFDVRKRIEDLDKAGIDKQVLSVSMPGVDFLNGAESAVLSRKINEEVAGMCSQHPRLIGLACIGLKEQNSAVREMERSVNELGIRGVSLFTHVNGTYLDSKRFWPFFKKAEELQVPIFVHPGVPKKFKDYEDYRLFSVLGLMDEITLCVVRMIYGGVLAVFPSLRLIFTHLGGSVPFLFRRVERGAYLLGKKMGDSVVFNLQKMHFDTVSFYAPALQCAIDTIGTDKMLMGSDYPFAAGSLEEAVQSINALDITEEDKKKILYENALNILKIN